MSILANHIAKTYSLEAIEMALRFASEEDRNGERRKES